MELTVVLAFAGVAALLIAVPGPDWAFVLAAGANNRLIAPAVAGLVAGYILLTLAVVAGVATLIASAPAVLLVLTLGGAAYLTYLGVGLLRTAHARTTASDDGLMTAPAWRILLRGVGVSALNPKGLLFFVAFLPQFARSDAAWPLPVQLAVLGCVWAVIVGAFYSAIGYTSDRVLAARPQVASLVSRIAGVAMISLSVALVLEQVTV